MLLLLFFHVLGTNSPWVDSILLGSNKFCVWERYRDGNGTDESFDGWGCKKCDGVRVGGSSTRILKFSSSRLSNSGLAFRALVGTIARILGSLYLVQVRRYLVLPSIALCWKTTIRREEVTRDVSQPLRVPVMFLAIEDTIAVLISVTIQQCQYVCHVACV